ncbi:hypothetical protein BU17DRAFT_60258 [Hysterangium stoloniferum]|nr:hypothetical protein BU17DRAFT_60258 [Hysterangium stoloniferum]
MSNVTKPEYNMRSSSQTIDIQTLSLDLGNYRAATVYDHFLTIGAEIDLIWPTPWNAGKVLFYATKYPALLDSAFLLYTSVAPPVTTPSTCELLYKIAGGMIVAGIAVAEFILVFRTWAVWGKNSAVGISLLCAAFILACPIGYFAYHGISPITYGPSPITSTDYVCWPVTPPGNIIFLDYILLVMFETSAFMLLMLLAGKVFCTIFTSPLRPKPSLALSVHHFRFPSYSKLTNYNSTQRVFHSILTARILVNLRKAARTNGTNYDTLTSANNTHRDRTLLSSIIGIDTWFQNSNPTTQMVKNL